MPTFVRELLHVTTLSYMRLSSRQKYELIIFCQIHDTSGSRIYNMNSSLFRRSCVSQKLTTITTHRRSTRTYEVECFRELYLERIIPIANNRRLQCFTMRERPFCGEHTLSFFLHWHQETSKCTEHTIPLTSQTYVDIYRPIQHFCRRTVSVCKGVKSIAMKMHIISHMQGALARKQYGQLTIDKASDIGTLCNW